MKTQRNALSKICILIRIFYAIPLRHPELDSGSVPSFNANIYRCRNKFGMTGLQHIVVLLANQYKAMEGDLATCRFDCKSAILKKIHGGIFLGKHGRDWSHAVGGHWTERPQGSEGSGWSESGMAESP